MTIRDVFVPFLTYPDAPATDTIDAAARIASALKANLSALVLELDPHRSAWPSSLGGYLVNLKGMIAEAIARSRANTESVFDKLQNETGHHRTGVELMREYTTLFPSPQPLVQHSRLHDLSILFQSILGGEGRSLGEAIVFESGRPALVIPDGKETTAFKKTGTAIVAWDSSRQAARALGDALPVLKLFEKLRVVTVTGEKDLPTSRSASGLLKHLEAHALVAELEEVEVGNRAIGEALTEYAIQNDADLLVMGAFGHSRAREFILGGATRRMLSQPPVPIFLSH